MTLVGSVVLFMVNVWQGAEFLASKRSGVAHVLVLTARVGLNRRVYVPLIIVSGGALVFLHFHDMRERERTKLVRDVKPGDRIITKEERSPHGSITQGVMGFQNATVTPKTAEASASALGFDPSRWATDPFTGKLYRTDFATGHEPIENGTAALLWLRPLEPDTSVDPDIWCYILPPGSAPPQRSPTVSEIGGPAGPNSVVRGGVPLSDYTITYPSKSFPGAPARLADGIYGVVWMSREERRRPHRFQVKGGAVSVDRVGYPVGDP
jgi:hypothetical protein